MGFSFHSPGCVKRAKGCRNDAFNGAPRAAKDQRKTRQGEVMTKPPGEVEPNRSRVRAFRLRNSPNQREGRLSDR
jgi:hypothetical protein